MIDRVQLKLEAKSIVKSALVSAYLFTLLYLVICFVLNGISVYVTGGVAEDISFYASVFYPELEFDVHIPVQTSFSPALVTFISLAISLLGVIINAGWICYHLGVRRRETMGYATLFDGFTFAGKLILLDIVVGIFTFLWSLLFVIPGIIASYRYRFAFYNLCENPQMGVMEALNMSKAQTDGYKGALFVLDLSFIGWDLLCGLTLGILSIWIAPYIAQTNLRYFDTIKAAKGIGYQPEDSADDSQFRPDDRFNDGSSGSGSGPRSYDPER